MYCSSSYCFYRIIVEEIFNLLFNEEQCFLRAYDRGGFEPKVLTFLRPTNKQNINKMNENQKFVNSKQQPRSYIRTTFLSHIISQALPASQSAALRQSLPTIESQHYLNKNKNKIPHVQSMNNRVLVGSVLYGFWYETHASDTRLFSMAVQVVPQNRPAVSSVYFTKRHPSACARKTCASI